MADRQGELERLRALADATADLRPTGDLDDAVMALLPVDDERLRRVGAATSDLDIERGFADEVMSAVAPSDAPVWSRIARETAEIRPADGFTSSVMRALKSRRRSSRAWPEGLMRSGRVALVAAAAVAAASVVLSSYSQRQLDADVLTTVDTVEEAE